MYLVFISKHITRYWSKIVNLLAPSVFNIYFISPWAAIVKNIKAEKYKHTKKQTRKSKRTNTIKKTKKHYRTRTYRTYWNFSMTFSVKKTTVNFSVMDLKGIVWWNSDNSSWDIWEFVTSMYWVHWVCVCKFRVNWLHVSWIRPMNWWRGYQKAMSPFYKLQIWACFGMTRVAQFDQGLG